MRIRRGAIGVLALGVLEGGVVCAASEETASTESQTDHAVDYEEYFGPRRDWPRFRGPLGDGVTTEEGLPTKWNARTGQNILWTARLPRGDAGVRPQRGKFANRPCGSPIVSRLKVYVTIANDSPGQHELICLSESRGELLLRQSSHQSHHNNSVYHGAAQEYFDAFHHGLSEGASYQVNRVATAPPGW